MTHAGTFRYFLGGLVRDALTPDVLRARGLADRLGECFRGQVATDTLQISTVRSGPDGKVGLLLVPMPAGGELVARSEYSPDHQDWHQSHHGDYWIGIDRDHHPTPAGCVRQETVAGYEHTLGDGRLWLCPTIRRALAIAAVPGSYSRLNGELTREPLPRYRGIWERSQKWASAYFSGMAPPDAFDACVECLATNYRVGAEEVSLLGLLTDQTISHVMDAALDWPWLQEAQSGADPKKKELWERLTAGRGSGSPGAGASSPTTPPATPT